MFTNNIFINVFNNYIIHNNRLLFDKFKLILLLFSDFVNTILTFFANLVRVVCTFYWYYIRNNMLYDKGLRKRNYNTNLIL